jgi:6-phosphogluconolactonase/glucosamine-6-phosphate isomerase/deaminase
MTFTYPIINRSHRILWLVTEREKREMLVLLQSGDSSIPAGRIRQDSSLLLSDRIAIGDNKSE